MLTVGFEGRGWLHECAFSSVRPKCLPRSEKHLILLLATRESLLALNEFLDTLDGDGEELISGLVTALDEFCAKPENFEVCIYILCNQVGDARRLFLQTLFCSKSSSNQDSYSWFGKESFS
jgi:hypothetical protein